MKTYDHKKTCGLYSNFIPNNQKLETAEVPSTREQPTKYNIVNQ